ncbi:MAG: mechanosensitive ion channel [Bacilli bacterium]|nr:mechanosensitive ion channel [Bacilli bacterium]
MVIDNFYKYLSSVTGIDKVYFHLIISTALVILIFSLLKKIAEFIISKTVKLEKQYNVNQVVQIILSLLGVLVIFFVWENYVKSLITLFSIVGASIIVALRESVLSFFAGIYIKSKKVFVVGDRIQVNDIKGDVVNISGLDFDILEIDNSSFNGQSTGIIISLPNSYVFTKEIKNLTKGFKYVWNEITVKVTLDSDLVSNKKELYKIVNSIDSVRAIINNMKDQSNIIGTDNKVYFNKYDPIIYTEIKDNYVLLTIRYLIDPKKGRIVNSVIWNKIYESYKDKKLKLYIGE